jgi:hypothetical protein
MGIFGLVIVAVLYWNEWFGLAFWLIVAIIINGVLGLIQAARNPSWYWAKRWREGVDRDGPPIIIDPRRHGRAMIELFIVKGITIPVFVFLAWHLGTRAGYFNFSN